MTLKYPDLILSAPEHYFGMRARTKKPSTALTRELQPRYTVREITGAIGVGLGAWSSWTRYAQQHGIPLPNEGAASRKAAQKYWEGVKAVRGGDVFGPNPTRASPMPHHTSAYMCLLMSEHPAYVLLFDGVEAAPVPAASAITPRSPKQLKATRGWPALDRATPWDVAEWRTGYGLGDYEGADEIAMAFGYSPEFNRRQSVAMIGGCGVRWNLLRLMMDAHPEMRAVRRSIPLTQGD